MEIIKSLMKALKFLDIYPQSFELNLNGKGKKKSSIGGVISVLTIIGTMILIIYSIYNFFKNRNPSVIIEKQYKSLMAPIKMKNTDIQMLLGLWNMDKLSGLPLNINYSHILLSDINTRRSMEGLPNPKVEIGKFVGCLNEHYPMDISNKIKELTKPKYFEGLLCLDLKKSDYLLGGDLFAGQNLFIEIEITFDSCTFLRNCTFNPTTEDTNLNFNLAFFDNFLNSSSEVGYTGFGNNYLFPFLINQTSNLKIKITDNVIITDSNYFYNLHPPEVNRFLQFESIEFSSSNKLETLPINIYQLNMQIEIPLFGYKITRVYPKIDSVISSINGILSIILFLSKLLHSIFNYGLVEHHLMKNLYYINDPFVFDKDKAEFVKSRISSNRDKITRARLTYQSLKNDQTKKEDVSIELNSPNTVNKLSNHTAENKYHELKNFLKGRQFEKNWFQWICIIICPFRRMDNSIKYFLYGKTLLYHDLNILVILRKLLFFESCFEIIFDNDQIQAMRGINVRVLESDMNINEVVRALNKRVLKISKPNKIDTNTFFNAYNNCFVSSSKKSQKIAEKINKLLVS